MKQFWKDLPTEFQFGIITMVLGIICWSVQFIHPVLENSIGAILTFLSSLAIGVLAHGATSRLSSNPSATKDLTGG